MYEFDTPGPITLAVQTRSGEATFIAEERDTATVEVLAADGSDASRDAAEHALVEMRDDTLVIDVPEAGSGWLWRRGGSVRIVARVPTDSTLGVKTASAAVAAEGRWREASVHSASGAVRVEEITGAVHVSTASGAIRLGRVGGDLKATSASGRITIESVDGDANVHSASGDIRVDEAASSISARTASGDIDVRHARRGEVRVQTASGDVTIAVAAGIGVYLDVSTVSGSTSSDLDVGDAPPEGKGADLAIRARTVSGDVAVVRADAKSYT